MAILLGTAKLGVDTRLSIPVGMWYNQIAWDESASPTFLDHLQIIQRPLPYAQYPFIACDRIAFSDARRVGETGPVAEQALRDRNVGVVRQAVKLNSDPLIPDSYKIKVSIGWIGKMYQLSSRALRRAFVNAICDEPGVDEVMESWHVIDEPVTAKEDDTSVTPSTMASVVADFHEAQVDRGKSWPFIYSENADGRTQPGTSNTWWQVVGQDRIYNPANVTDSTYGWNVDDGAKIMAYVDGMSGKTHLGVNSKLILAPFDYMWAGFKWRYAVSPPWRMWRQIHNWWKSRTGGASGDTFPFYALVEGAAQTHENDPIDLKSKTQGHVGMHNQMRMALGYGFQGVWLWGWTTSATGAPDLDLTKSHWTHDNAISPQNHFYVSTEKERWGEAVSSEMWRNIGTGPDGDKLPTDQAEWFAEAIPPPPDPLDPDNTGSGLRGTRADKYVDPQTGAEKAPSGYWIQYDLHESGRVYFLIRDSAGDVVRVLDWGFRVDDQRPTPAITLAELLPLSPGRYRNMVTENPAILIADRRPDVDGVSGDMNGTAQYWDLKDDNNGVVPGGPTDVRTYTIEMYRDGTQVGPTLSVVKPMPEPAP